jgi:hypothetical protein
VWELSPSHGEVFLSRRFPFVSFLQPEDCESLSLEGCHQKLLNQERRMVSPEVFVALEATREVVNLALFGGAFVLNHHAIGARE